MAKENENKPVSESVKTATRVITDAEERTCTFTKTFKVNGHNKTGTFKFRYPSVIDRAQIGIARAKMLDGASEQSLDRITSDLTYMIAFIGKLCIKQPKWFNLSIIDDYDILRNIFDEVTQWVKDFRQQMATSEDDGDSNAANDEEDLDGDEAVSRSDNA